MEMVDYDCEILRNRIRDAVSAQDACTVLDCSRMLLHASGKQADMMLCSTAFTRLADSLARLPGLRKLKVFVVRSVTIEPLLPALSVEAALSNYLLHLEMGGFGSYADELLNPASALAESKPDLVLILLDLEEIAGRLPGLCANGTGADVGDEIDDCAARIASLLNSFRAHNSARIVLQGLVVPDLTSLGDIGDGNLPHSLPRAVSTLNQKLAALCATVSDCVFFDADRLAARFGKAQWRDQRMFLASRLPVSTSAFRVFAHGLVRSFSALFRAPRKVLCTDLDNTLWGGVLGEDGPQGIATGSSFPGNCYLAYQTHLKQLSSRGILLALVSKNNPADVEEVFRLRSSDLALSLDDFVSSKIGWERKSESIRALAKELSLGLDSFVFIDDNPAECEEVRHDCPQVAVLQAPLEEPWRLAGILAQQPFFDAVSVTGDDLNRLNEYKAQEKRAELAASLASPEQFLASLEIVCTFESALHAPLSRAAQLMAKTNQFNLTTRRHSAAEIEDFATQDGGLAIAIRVRDRFGDAGVVGLALASTHADACIIDSLLLSCRVIGRGIETALLAYIAEHARRAGATRLVGEFIATAKNAPCATFYPDHGFVPLSADSPAASLFYELNLDLAAPLTPTWITREGNDFHEHSDTPPVAS